jgi:hypothetical protein
MVELQTDRLPALLLRSELDYHQQLSISMVVAE